MWPRRTTSVSKKLSQMRSTLLTMWSHTHDQVISRIDLLDLASREQKRTKKTAITLLQVKTNLTISANLTKTILFNRKIFLKNSPKNRMHFDKTSTKKATRNSKKFSATQRKKQPNSAGKPPNWQHCRPRYLLQLRDSSQCLLRNRKEPHFLLFYQWESGLLVRSHGTAETSG